MVKLKISVKKNPECVNIQDLFVGPLGIEPRLFGTKNRRVASYTIGHSDIESANLIQSFILPNNF